MLSRYYNESYISTGRRSVVLEDDDYPLELKECSKDYIECVAERYLLIIGCPLLIVLALVGNSITFSVMMRPKLRCTATAIYIATLAIMDTVANITGLTRHFILKVFQIDIRQLSGISCTTHRFFLYISLDTSAWLLALITVERFIAVCKPHRHKKINSMSVALRTVAMLILIQILFNIHVFWTRGKHYKEFYHDDDKSPVVVNCGYTSKEARHFWANHQGWMSTLWYSLFPFTVMLVLNIFIIRRLRTLEDRSLARDSSTVSATGITKQTSSMTRMLLSVTLYFMVVTTPVFIFTMFQSFFFYNEIDEISEHTIAKIELADAILTMLLYLNHSINFFLYCLTGRRFRRELKAMCGCLKAFGSISISVKKSSSEKVPHLNQDYKMGLTNGTNSAIASNSPMLRAHWEAKEAVSTVTGHSMI